MSLQAKAVAFQRLHAENPPLILPNPWDAGSARLLRAMGFKALATTSAGLAFSLGVKDSAGMLTRVQVLDNAASIVDATSLPVSADLENGFGDSPEDVAQTIRMAAEAGLVGGSIEDASGEKYHPIYDFNHALERIQAGVEAARNLPFPFTFVARAENFSVGRGDLDDTIRRLLAFEKAGADVLYAPALPTLEAIRMVCTEVQRPVNVVIGFGGIVFSVAELADAGVRRISLGSSLARAALGGLVRAAQEIQQTGTFAFMAEAITFAEVNGLMAPSNE